jgi:signal transduction histidine kinase
MKSIRRHLTCVLAGAIALVFAASGLLVRMLVERALTDQFDTALLERARILGMNLEEDDGELKIDKNLRGQDLPEDGATPAVFDVYDASGRLVLSYLRRDGSPPMPFRKMDSAEPEFYAATLGKGRPARVAALRVDAMDDKQGLFKNLTLLTALPAPDIAATVRTLTFILAGTGLAALLVLLPALRAALRRGLQPLDTLAERTAAIDVRKLGTQLPEDDAPLELKPVVSTLNALLRRLETSFARERRFSSDVAHELRTPVAELRSLGEMVANWPAEATPAAFADVLAISREMVDIVNRLTVLSRADAGTQPVTLTDLSLTHLVQETIDRITPAALARGHTITTALTEVALATDATLWKMILTNLLGNAVAHAPAGSIIRAALTPAGFTLTNPAPDLRGEDLPRLFDRFWRKDASRTGYGHSGLGLSLVHSLAALLGLELRAHLTSDGQLEITLTFPPAAGSPPPAKAEKYVP